MIGLPLPSRPPSRPPKGSTAIEVVESWLPSTFSSSGRHFEAWSPRLRLSLSGPDRREWELQIKDSQLLVERYVRRIGVTVEDPDIWIRQTSDDFLAVVFTDDDLFELLPPSVDIVDLLSPDSAEMELLEKLDGRIKFELQGRRRRRWAVDAAFGRAGILAGRPRTTVTIDTGTFEKLAARTMNPLQALLGGRLRVEGDRTFAMQVLMLVATRVGG